MEVECCIIVFMHLSYSNYDVMPVLYNDYLALFCTYAIFHNEIISSLMTVVVSVIYLLHICHELRQKIQNMIRFFMYTDDRTKSNDLVCFPSNFATILVSYTEIKLRRHNQTG